VDRNNPANRDQRLTIYASGLGLTKGGRVTGGTPSPASPLAVPDAVQVFFGDPKIKQAAVLVESSNLVPGAIGIYEVHVYVPGDHLRGDSQLVTLRIGGVDSPKTGPVVPAIPVN
jgi:uncharacterized protein (TIGR03437 family)